jgi:hypothetical protein
LSFTREAEFIVMDGLKENILLGMNCISTFFSAIGIIDGELTFRTDLTPDQTEKNKEVHAYSPIRVSQGTLLPPRSIRWVSVTYSNLSDRPDTPVLCRALSVVAPSGDEVELGFPPHIQDMKTMARKNSRYSLLIQNPSHETICLRVGEVVGRADTLPSVPCPAASDRLDRSVIQTTPYRPNQPRLEFVKVKNGRCVEHFTAANTSSMASAPAAAPARWMHHIRMSYEDEEMDQSTGSVDGSSL